MGTDISKEIISKIEAGDEKRIRDFKYSYKFSKDEIKKISSIALEKNMYGLYWWVVARDYNALAKITDVRYMESMARHEKASHHITDEYYNIKHTHFANENMLLLFVKITKATYLLDQASHDCGPRMVDKFIPYYETLPTYTLAHSVDNSGKYLADILTNIIAPRKDANTREFINGIKNGKDDGIIKYAPYINYRVNVEGESLLMLALRFGTRQTAKYLINRVDLAHTQYGKTALHYAFVYDTTLVLEIFNAFRPPWDPSYVTADMNIMQRFMESYILHREDDIQIFSRMTTLYIVDETLRDFFNSIQTHIAMVDIPNLLKLLSRFPLTYDRLSAIIQPTLIAKLEKEVERLQAGVVVQPPSYQEN